MYVHADAAGLYYRPRFGHALAKWEGSPQVKQQPCTVSPVAETNVMPSASAFPRPLLPRPPPLRPADADADADACLPPPRLPRPRPLGPTLSSSSSHLHCMYRASGERIPGLLSLMQALVNYQQKLMD